MSDPHLPLITAEFVLTDLSAADRDDAARQLATPLHKADRVTDLDGFLSDVRAREAQTPTGMPGRVGLPHARSAHVRTPSLAVGIAPGGVDYQGPDGTARLIFLIAAPEAGNADHMKILAALARRLIHAEFRDSLVDAPDARTVADIVNREVAVP
ncbi:PTS system fructose-specific IIA component [Spinactinospora alkalitolerans]|uniref:PTS system fructose-specific IIA component n=1 Tax=Spinactinospora alkalitolerans TaxID=687207 RepID=A0A852TQY0_9ACTN|nr:PTS sugar transporter subunit IIA [Spinactinospora alkalitolerans]NYE45961.1 PTS system fructose-specific IIA component [Spinactinospora alkalitolerans]